MILETLVFFVALGIHNHKMINIKEKKIVRELNNGIMIISGLRIKMQVESLEEPRNTAKEKRRMVAALYRPRPTNE